MNTFLETLQTMVQKGDHLIVAVSGGADSMALLHLLQTYQVQGGYTFEVAHVHHHLRDASDAEWQFVESYCHQHQIAFHGRHLDVRGEQSRQGKSMEAVAHDLRLAALQEVVTVRQAQWLLLAHHANDRAETLLMNLLRGSAINGLAAMPMVQGNIVRPLLKYTREDIEAYCAQHHLAYVTDESNTDTRMTRNRIRHELLPILQSYNSNVVGALNHLAENATCEQEFIKESVQTLYEECVYFHGKQWCLLQRAPIAKSHAALQAALIQEVSEKILGTRSGVHQDILNHCLLLIKKGSGRYDLGQGLIFEWTKQWCYIGFQPQGQWIYENGQWHHDFLESIFSPHDEAEKIRTYQSGDVLYEKGLGRKSIKKIFQEQGFPITLRKVWPIVYNNDVGEAKYIPFLAPTQELVYDIKKAKMGKYSCMTINQKKCFFKESF